ncbi:MAG: D-alanyl-D-alanine carboxypeptidase family protein [Desulfotomaculales bacterium]
MKEWQAALQKLLILFLMIVTWPKTVVAAPPALTCEAAVLMDAQTGQVYLAKNPSWQMHPASLTKIMTAVVALEAGDLRSVATISERAAYTSDGSIIDLHPGERIRLGELLEAALIMSAHDATVAIAEHVAGDHDLFVQWMNLKAKLLGAHRTHFVNTNGYTHPNHYSTAYDLALITRYALRNPRFAGIVRMREAEITWEGERREVISNTNRLLFSDFQGINGVKTGTTSAAGQCLIASASRGDRGLIAVVLNSGARYRDAIALLTYGFEGVKPLVGSEKGDFYTRVLVRGGERPNVVVVPARTVRLYLPEKQNDSLQKEVRLVSSMEAPVRAGQKAGEMIFYLGGLELSRVPLVAKYAVDRRPWYKRG